VAKSLPKIILVDEQDTIGVFELNLYADTLIHQLQNGTWKPPIFPLHDQNQSRQEGSKWLIRLETKTFSSQLNCAITEREMDILQGLATGLTDGQIAKAQGIKPRTVRFYIARLKGRFGAITREHLIAKAGKLGLFNLDA
jgi:DNA-binding CsgD family transcriptional regulator